MAPLIVITGPTASGKTSLALSLAERHNGEIICADSRTVYEGMDIGTAKPTVQEQAHVPHHLLDVVRPDEKYTVANFQKATYRVVDEIRSRHHIPFLVGGTGLYIDAVVREYEWPETSGNDAGHRALEALTTANLQSMIKLQHLAMPMNQLNRRHLINTLMRSGNEGISLASPRENTVVVAITTDKKILETRIRERAHMMFETGVVEETERLAELYGWDSEAMSSNIYPIVRKVIEGEITEQQAIELFVIKDRQLAKRQISWLKRHDYMKWFSLPEAEQYIETILG